MMIFSVGIELANVVAVQCPHDADARKHRRAAARHEHQRFDRSLPLLGLVLGLRELCDVGCIVFERDELATARGSGIGSSNGRFQPLGDLGEEIGALLREHQIASRRMQRDPTVRDGGLDRRAVFLIAAPASRNCRLMISTDSRPA
jgi:hypothetical protein